MPFTLVFDGELRELDRSPFKTDTPFGLPVAAAQGDAIVNGDEVSDKIERLREALESCASWIDRWTHHVGHCKGADKCTCGRSAVLFEANAALGTATQLVK